MKMYFETTFTQIRSNTCLQMIS